MIWRSGKVGLLALTVLAFMLRLVAFQFSPHPLGTDGYYYVVQAADWSTHGLHVPDSSWMLRLLGLLGAIFEPVQATKLCAALLAAAVVPAAWWLGGALGRPRLLAVWAAASPTLTHLAADFPKNLAIAAPWFVFCGAILRKRWGVAVVAGLLMATAHKLGAVLLVLSLTGWAVSSLSRRVFGGLLLAAALLVVLSALPGMLHWGEGFRITGQVVIGDGVPPFCWFSRIALPFPEQVEWVAALAGLCCVRSRMAPLALPMLLLAVLPIWRADVLDLGYRLALITPMLAAPLLAERLPRAPWWTVFLVPLAWGGSHRALPPYDRFDMLIEALPRPLPDLLIAHQGVNFLYDHRTGAEALAWAPDPHLDPSTVGRLVWGVRESEWVGFGVSHVRLDADYAYVREPAWRDFVERAQRRGDDDLNERIRDWRNPHRVRPSALVRNREENEGPAH